MESTNSGNGVVNVLPAPAPVSDAAPIEHQDHSQTDQQQAAPDEVLATEQAPPTSSFEDFHEAMHELTKKYETSKGDRLKRLSIFAYQGTVKDDQNEYRVIEQHPIYSKVSTMEDRMIYKLAPFLPKQRPIKFALVHSREVALEKDSDTHFDVNVSGLREVRPQSKETQNVLRKILEDYLSNPANTPKIPLVRKTYENNSVGVIRCSHRLYFCVGQPPAKPKPEPTQQPNPQPRPPGLNSNESQQRKSCCSIN